VGQQLLARFPDHAGTQEALGDLHMEQSRYDEGLALYQTAAKANPLNRQLRTKLVLAHLYHARSCVLQGRFDDARADYQAALALSENQNPAGILCKWAGCEFKAGQAEQAEALLERARNEGGQPLDIAFQMLTESIRLKLAKPLKTRFEKAFNAGLTEKPTGAAVAAVAFTAAAHRANAQKYLGEKTHEKKVLAFIAKAYRTEFTEEQLASLCRSLIMLEANKPLEKFAALGQRHFPENPQFPYAAAEALIARGPDRCPLYRVHPLLERAQQLAGNLPEDRRKELLDIIEQRRAMIGMAGGLMAGLEEMLGNFMDFDDEDDFDDGEPQRRRRRRR
jgi:tetratricopeptide (TPR) repeat protein